MFVFQLKKYVRRSVFIDTMTNRIVSDVIVSTVTNLLLKTDAFFQSDYRARISHCSINIVVAIPI